MLCPEVWNFKAPELSISTKKHKTNENSHLETINDFAYSHLVSIVLPDTFKVPETLTETLSNDCDYYKLIKVKLSEFVNKDFIHNFVNSGCLYVLTVGTRIDCDNCAALTPQGKLILNLDKTTYQSSGLQGTVSHYHTLTKDRYIVTIDLKSEHFKPGKSNYEKVKTCLEGMEFDVIVTWEPPSDTICPSSIAKYFHDLGYGVKLCEIQQKSHLLYSVKVPTLQNDNLSEFVEWLGMVSLDANLTDGAPDSYVSTYETLEPNHVVGQVKFMQWRGFFTKNQIARLFNRLSEFQRNKGSEWVAMYVQGFSDSVIAWKDDEHHFYTNGDSSYTFILTNDDVISYLQQCSRKRYRNKRKGKPY